MKRTIGLFILAFALPGLAQSDPPTAPVATPDPTVASPFLDSVSVKLQAGATAEVWWDTGSSTTPLNPGDGNLYLLDQAIVIHGTTILRTVADYPGMGQAPMTANFNYARDVKPTIGFSSPTASQSFKVGQTIHIAATATDPDGPAPVSIRFLRSNGTGWMELASGSVAAPPYTYTYDWALDGTAPIGSVQIRTIVKDAKGATDSATVSVMIAANKAPIVNLTSPANNASFLAPASVTLNASANDSDGSITKVEFWKGTTLLGIDSVGPTWSWRPITLAESTYVFKAVAYDNGTPVLSGNSPNVTVNVVKNNPPAVSITIPQNNKTYYAPYSPNVTATATDNDGGVAKVEFFNGTTLEATDSVPPWSYAHTYQAGIYSLTAKATDSLGATATSAAVAFTVIANQKPTAKTGKDTTIILSNNACQLNGSGSSDPEGTTLKFKWTAPAGVTFNNDTLANPIATFPSNAGNNYALQLKVTDRADQNPLSDSVKQTVSVWSKPAITSTLAMAAIVKQSWGYTISGTGFPAPTFDAPAASRPSWLNYNPATSSLYGTPPSQGSFTVGLTASNSAGTDSKTLAITVGDSLYKPSIKSALTATGKYGTQFNYAITALGNPSNFTYAATGLPGGITLNTGNGMLAGIPTASGTFTVSITVSNSMGHDQKNLILTVNQDPQITKDLPDSLPTVMDQASASFSIAATGYPNPSYQWQFSSASATTGFVPVGTNANSYKIDSVSLASTGWYRVIVKNGSGPDVTSKACHLQVKPLPAPVKITQNPTAQTAVIGDKVQFKARATGEAPLYYRWFRGYPTRTAMTNGKIDDTVFTLDTANATMSGVYSVRVTTTNFPGDSLNPSYFAWSDTARLVVQLPKLAKPTANPAGGTIYAATQVALAPPMANATIWYSLNGVDPVQGAPNLQYVVGAPILIDSTRTLKARAYYPNVYRASDVMTEVYTLTAQNKSAKPIIKPADSTFTGTLTVTITAPDGSDVYYTTDGSDPLASTQKCPPEGFVISNTTLVNAVAKKSGLLASDTAMKIFTLAKPVSKVLNPQFSPDGGSFTGVLAIRITSPTPGAILHYTLDGTDPDSLSAVLVGAGLTLTKTTQVKVVGMLKDYANSEIVTGDFRLGPGSIVATPAGDTIFDDHIAVKLTVTPAEAVIHYTVDGSQPTDQSAIFPAAGQTFTTTTTLTAIAYLGTQPGKPQSFGYTLNHGPLITPIPTTANNASTFKDTLIISLQSTPGAAIYYTLDGSEPAIIPGNLYQKPIVLDRTATLQAMAVENGFENSKVLVATYTLVPRKPDMNPPGGAYSLPIFIRLSDSSRTANLFYTLDGTTPTTTNGQTYVKGSTIRLDTAATLKAVAIAGNVASEVVSETYNATQASDNTLSPGHTLFLDGGYTLRNPEDEQATVQVHIGPPPATGLDGFDAVQYTLNLSIDPSAGGAAQAFPKITFTTPASEKRSLYKMESTGKIFFVSSADTVTLGAGTYFMGIDTLPPIITYAKESFGDKDSTRIVFNVHDNVSNLGYNLNRNDDTVHNLSGGILFSDQPFSVQVKHAPGIVKPLYVQLIVSDYRQAAYFPGDPNVMLSVSQKLSPLQGPAAWKIGARAKSLYDFVSIPLALNPPLTLAGLAALNPKAGIEGAECCNSANHFTGLDRNTALQAGHGYWIASRSPVSSLHLDHAETAPSGGKTTFSVTLRKGWNQIANPLLETLYWPFTPALDGSRSALVKGLWAWDPTLATPDYAASDSLVPWRGYFVYNYGEVIEVPLLTRPISAISAAPPAAKASAEARNSLIQMALGWDGRASLRLGADPASRDGLGIEDEEALPQFGTRYLRAVREGHALSSDWVRLDRQGVQRWRVEFGSEGDSLPSLRIADLSLPAGDEAWAFSPSRGMKFPLVPGAEISASGLARDSLLVVAGPKEMIASLDLMREFSAMAPRLDAKVMVAPDGFRLRMALPSRAHVRATVWSLQGARLGDLATGLLSEGTYDFAFARDFSRRPARLGPGMFVLTVDVRGQDVSARLNRKILIAR